MYPHERSLVKKLEGKPFVLLGVNSDKSKEQLKEIAAKEKMTWRSWFDGPSKRGPIATQWNVRSWPTIYVIDHKGVIRYRDIREQKLEEAIETLVAEAEKDAATPSK